MADLSKVRLNGTVYNFKDAEARLLIETLPLATTSTNGLMSATDKQVIDNLNPNVTINITDWYNSDLEIINAKQLNALGLEIKETPHISSQIRTNNLIDANSYTPGFYISSNGGNLHIGDNWSAHGVIPSNGAYIRVSWGSNDTNVMLSVGAPTKYEPYYLTPFEPITSTVFQLANNSAMENATTYTINVPANIGNVYGYNINPIEGKLYLTTGHIASYNNETLPGLWWSDRDVYNAESSPTIGAEVVYELSSNDIVEYNITPIDIPLFYHTNCLHINHGEIVNFSYYAETFAVSHLTISNGITFGDNQITESSITGWNYAADNIDLKANIHSPVLTGTPLSTTPTITTNSDRIATTAYTNHMFGSIVAPDEANNGKASKNYSVDEFLIFQGKLYKVTTAIAQNTTLTPGTNIAATDVATELNLLRSLIS